MRITVNGNRVGFASGKKIRPDQWDEKAGIALGVCQDHQLINSYVSKTKVDLDRCYNQLAVNTQKITAAMIKSTLKLKNTATTYNKQFAYI